MSEGINLGETIVFWVCAGLATLGALGLVLSRKAVHSALWMALTMINLAILYVANAAPFLGMVQVIVYMFLFVLMLIGVDSAQSLVETIRGQRVAAALAGVGFGVLLIAGIGSGVSGGFAGLTQANAGGNVEGLAQLIFTRNLWAFELTSALLITAALGAMILAHRERLEPRKTQREMAIERFRGTGRATPLPNPGVYARRNAVDTMALLPDGSEEQSSVSATIRGPR